MIKIAYVYNKLKLNPPAKMLIEQAIGRETQSVSHGRYFPKAKKPDIIVVSLILEDEKKDKNTIKAIQDYVKTSKKPVFVAIWYLSVDLPQLEGHWITKGHGDHNKMIEKFTKTLKKFTKRHL